MAALDSSPRTVQLAQMLSSRLGEYDNIAQVYERHLPFDSW